MQHWEFIREFWFFVFLGIIAVVPLAMLTAAYLGVTYANAFIRVKKFLKTWASFAGKTAWVSSLTGFAQVSGMVVLLAFFAWGICRFGDQTLPHLSGVFGHFGNERVAWSITHMGEWEQLRTDYQKVTGIGTDLIRYEEAKARMGSFDYSFYRTLFWLGMVVVIAGTVNLWPRSAWRKRGSLELSLGLLVAFISVWGWADRQDRFIRKMVSECREKYTGLHGTPMTWPAHYPPTSPP